MFIQLLFLNSLSWWEKEIISCSTSHRLVLEDGWIHGYPHSRWFLIICILSPSLILSGLHKMWAQLSLLTMYAPFWIWVGPAPTIDCWGSDMLLSPFQRPPLGMDLVTSTHSWRPAFTKMMISNLRLHHLIHLFLQFSCFLEWIPSIAFCQNHIKICHTLCTALSIGPCWF